VQFIDKSVKAQLGLPDMRMCIQYALTFNNKETGGREKSGCKELDLTKTGGLSFAKPDSKTFIFPELARHAVKEGGTLPAVMNAANEAAVELFLNGRISFPGIFDLVEKSAGKHKNIKNPNIDEIIYCTEEATKEIKRHFI
jgi:1-deoxy-D-xylulose-5-phosphate reductoisomerase